MIRAHTAVTPLLAGLLAWTGCDKSPATNRPAGDSQRLRIGFLVKKAEEPWFQDEWKFAEQAAKKHDFDLIKIAAPDGEKVLSAIDKLAAQSAAGFVICTPDVRLGPAIMAKAGAHGLKVFSVDDQFVGSDGRPMDVPYLGISAKAIGQTVGKALSEEFKRRGYKADETGLCAVTFDELETCRLRLEGAIETLKTAGFPGDRVFRAPVKTTDIPGAFDTTNTLLTQRPNVKRWMICSFNDEGVLGAVRAMEGRGFGADSILGVGIGGSNTEIEFRKEKPTGFYGTCLLEIRRHGYETTELLYRWIRQGVQPPKATYTAGVIITRDNYQKIMKEQGVLSE